MRLAAGRYLGTAASVLLTFASYTAGARQTGQPEPLSWQRILAEPSYAWGCVGWVTGVAGLCAAWVLIGPAIHRRRAGWTVTTIALWTVPLLAAVPLGSRDVYAYANQGALYLAGFSPYQTGPAAHPTPWLDQMAAYWQDSPAPYGPAFLLLAAAIAWLAGEELTVAVAGFRLLAVAGALLTVWSMSVLARYCTVPVAGALWLTAASPLWLIHLIGGAHNDALLLAGVLTAMALACRGRAVSAGCVLGLAVAVKATALVTAPFLVLLLADGPRWIQLWRRGWMTAIACLASFSAVTAASGLGLGWLPALQAAGKSQSWLSPPTGWGIAAAKVAAKFGWDDIAGHMVGIGRTIGLFAAAVVVIALWWRARGAPARTIVASSGWACGAVVVLGPVMLSWYLLLPLALLACAVPSRRTVTLLAVCATVFTVIVLGDGLNLAARFLVKPGLVWDAVLAVGLATLAWRWWRSRDDAAPLRSEAVTPHSNR